MIERWNGQWSMHINCKNSKKINHWDGVREVPVGKCFLPNAVYTCSPSSPKQLSDMICRYVFVFLVDWKLYCPPQPLPLRNTIYSAVLWELKFFILKNHKMSKNSSIWISNLLPLIYYFYEYLNRTQVIWVLILCASFKFYSRINK